MGAAAVDAPNALLVGYVAVQDGGATLLLDGV